MGNFRRRLVVFVAQSDRTLYKRGMADSKRGPVVGPGGLITGLDSRTGLSNRTFERTQGCWNCAHYRPETAKEWWKTKRQQDLQAALSVALESPMKEGDPQVVNTRRMVDAIDVGLATGNLGMCIGKGVDAQDNPVGDLVKSNYLCRKWTGAEGASVARAGQAADPLPMELEDKTS